MKTIIFSFIVGTILLSSCLTSSRLATPVIPQRVDKASAYYNIDRERKVAFTECDRLFQILKKAKCTRPFVFGAVKVGSRVLYVELETELDTITFTIPYCYEYCKEISIRDYKNKLIYDISDPVLFQEINSIRRPAEKRLEQLY